MSSKKIPGAVTATPKSNGLPVATPKVVAMEVYDPDEKVFRVEVVRLLAA